MVNDRFIEWDTEPASLREKFKTNYVKAAKNGIIPHEILPNSCENHRLLWDANNFWMPFCDWLAMH